MAIWCNRSISTINSFEFQIRNFGPKQLLAFTTTNLCLASDLKLYQMVIGMFVDELT